MGVGHLAKRFFGSVNPAVLGEDESSWVASQLLPAELELWARMSTADQRHAYGVGQRVVKILGEDATRPVVAAALLHDIGKIEANVGTMLRVVSTLVGTIADQASIESWSKESGWLGRAGQYLRHNEIGAAMLTDAGSDPLTIAWAREHELVHTEWTLPEKISDALYKADNA